MKPFLGIAIKDVKTLFREKGRLFWTIAFPLAMMLLFAAIFGREVPFAANIGVVDFDKTETTNGIIQALNNTEIFDVKIIDDEQQAIESLEEGDVSAVITFREGFDANITTGRATRISLDIDETSPDTAQIVRSGLQAFFSEVNKDVRSTWVEFAKGVVTVLLNYTQPDAPKEVILDSMDDIIEPISITEEKPLTRKAIGYKEYVLAGVLSFPFLFSSMAGAAEIIVSERLMGTLKRIRVSPTSPLSMLWGKTLAVLTQTAISILLLALLGYLLLNPIVTWNIPLLAPIMFLGSINGIAIGLLISSIARSPQEASGAATAIAVILHFFIGMYFPLEILPNYLQTVGRVIPMTNAANIMKGIMLKDVGLNEVLPTMTLLLVSAVILYLLGALLYKRWVEKE
jgi:ABC-2 type transport system permease protein